MLDTTNDGAIRVLIAEDHLLMRVGLTIALQRTDDIKVIGEAENGEVAVSMVDELLPNVVLMDVGMPVMDGIEATRKILERHDSLHVIMLTCHDDEQEIFASIAAGASGYCIKDAALERLFTAIRSVHNGDIWLDATIAQKVLDHYCPHRTTNDKEFWTKPGQTQLEEVPDIPPVQTDIDIYVPQALSRRETEVIALVTEGLSNQEIADELSVSLATAKTHVRNILNKLAVNDRTKAAVHAVRRKLVA